MSFKLHVMEKEMKLEDDIEIAAVTDIEVPSFVKGYHVYRNLWTPILKEENHLIVEMMMGCRCLVYYSYLGKGTSLRY